MADPKTTTVNGHELYITRTGVGPPLLLIQGLGGHSAHWGTRFPELLAERLELIAFDHLGTGRSGWLESALSIRGMADDGAALLAELEVDRAHVLGLSMGGMVAQALALAHPERVGRLVLMSTSPSASRGVMMPPATLEALSSAWTSGDPERALRTAFEVNVSAEYAARGDALEEWRPIAADHPVSLEVLGAQIAAIRDHDALDDLAQLEPPTLVVHGTDDQVLPVGNADLIAEAVPRARLERFEGIGHLLYLEQPDRAAELVIEFLLD